jgi:hypothetical protein
MSAAINSNQLGPEASWPVSGAGRELGIHPSFLFDHLRRHGWLIRRPGDTGDRAASEAIASGDMTNFPVLVARHAGKLFFRLQPRLTQKGIEPLRREPCAFTTGAASGILADRGDL